MRKMLLIILLTPFFSQAQNRGNVWCFGDSAGIDFNNINNPTPIHSAVKSRGSCASISDKNGNLLFYSSYNPQVFLGTGGDDNGEVYNRYNQLMLNGDSINYEGWYMECIIIPFLEDTNKYYLFTIGVTDLYGLYYSVIDMTLDSGRGAVILKNIQLQSAKSTDCVVTIKHGNGRDWWLFYRRWDNSNNEFYPYLISPSGISLQAVQSVGTQSSNGFLTMTFSPSGDKLVVKTFTGLIEIYDFDRCTGLISNPITLDYEVSSSPYPGYWDCEFSPDGNLLYVVISQQTSYLLQYNLLSPNPTQTRDTLFTITYPTFSGGFLKLAPDGKIYWSCSWYDGVNYNFPYPDTTYNSYNTSLSVINYPDSLGAACNFTPYSFYLGGARCYLGLPNNPDYEMPRLQGSPCDTVHWAGVQDIEQAKGTLNVTYVNAWEKAFVNAQHLKGNTYTLRVTDIMGRIVFKEQGKLQPPYFTKDLDCSHFSGGLYIVTLTTNKE